MELDDIKDWNLPNITKEELDAREIEGELRLPAKRVIWLHDLESHHPNISLHGKGIDRIVYVIGLIPVNYTEHPTLITTDTVDNNTLQNTGKFGFYWLGNSRQTLKFDQEPITVDTGVSLESAMQSLPLIDRRIYIHNHNKYGGISEIGSIAFHPKVYNKDTMRFAGLDSDRVLQTTGFVGDAPYIGRFVGDAPYGNISRIVYSREACEGLLFKSTKMEREQVGYRRVLVLR